MKTINVLLVPSSSGMAIAAIKMLKKDKNIRVISTDTNKLAPGLYLSDKGYLVPPFDHKSFYPKLRKIIKKENVHVVIPCLDTILLDFSDRRGEFEKIGAKVLVSEARTIRITRDKWKIYNKLMHVIPLPKSFIRKGNINIGYPLLIKPRMGSGSKNVNKINSRRELDFFYSRTEKPIIQEYLTGKEYTVDCLADMKGNLVVSIPRERIETRSGISVKGKIVISKELDKIARKIAQNLKFTGPFFFQAKEDENKKPKLMEINTRISGTMCLSDLSGVNIHVMAVKMCMGKKVKKPEIKKDIYLTRYWEEIYLDDKEMKKRLNYI